MRRTQIYLTDEEWKTLQQTSRREKASVSALIRQAVDLCYLKRRSNTLQKALEEVTGIWADREDLGSTEEYVRSLRKDTRRQRLALK